MAESICSRETCERPAHTKGLCKSHYTVMRRNHPDRPRCSVDRCERPRYAKALCTMHYQQLAGPRERHRIASRDYARRNQAAMTEKNRVWRAANPEKRRAARRRWMAVWRAANPDAARTVFREWIAANPTRWAELQRVHS